MNVYTCNKFTGCYPVGVAAVVVAESAEQACFCLNSELKFKGLPGDAEQDYMKPLDMRPGIVTILNDGNY